MVTKKIIQVEPKIMILGFACPLGDQVRAQLQQAGCVDGYFPKTPPNSFIRHDSEYLVGRWPSCKSIIMGRAVKFFKWNQIKLLNDLFLQSTLQRFSEYKHLRENPSRVVMLKEVFSMEFPVVFFFLRPQFICYIQRSLCSAYIMFLSCWFFCLYNLLFPFSRGLILASSTADINPNNYHTCTNYSPVYFSQFTLVSADVCACFLVFLSFSPSYSGRRFLLLFLVWNIMCILKYRGHEYWYNSTVLQQKC